MVFVLYRLHYIVCTISFVLYRLYYIVCTISFALYRLYYIVCTIHNHILNTQENQLICSKSSSKLFTKWLKCNKTCIENNYHSLYSHIVLNCIHVLNAIYNKLLNKEKYNASNWKKGKKGKTTQTIVFYLDLFNNQMASIVARMFVDVKADYRVCASLILNSMIN